MNQTKKRKKKNIFIKKRFLILIIIATFPFFKLYHPDDFCFGDAQLLTVAVLTIFYVVAFLTVFFYNLYKITLKVELFNFIPVTITIVFFVALFVGLKFHDNNPFKSKTQIFKINVDEKTTAEISLFKDKTFEYKKSLEKSYCTNKGTYYYQKDTLFLKTNVKNISNKMLDSVYVLSKINNSLNPLNKSLPKFNLIR